jgi:hypothetical protein
MAPKGRELTVHQHPQEPFVGKPSRALSPKVHPSGIPGLKALDKTKAMVSKNIDCWLPVPQARCSLSSGYFHHQQCSLEKQLTLHFY